MDRLATLPCGAVWSLTGRLRRLVGGLLVVACAGLSGVVPVTALAQGAGVSGSSAGVSSVVPRVKGQCTGAFVNPVSNVCWACMFPVKVGNTSLTGKEVSPSLTAELKDQPVRLEISQSGAPVNEAGDIMGSFRIQPFSGGGGGTVGQTASGWQVDGQELISGGGNSISSIVGSVLSLVMKWRPSPSDGPAVCACATPFPRVGVNISMWEPAVIAEASINPYCFSGLGGYSLNAKIGAWGTGAIAEAAGDDSDGSSHWHVHWYAYPVASAIQFLEGFVCFQRMPLDVMYISELDPTWNDPELALIFNPDAKLYANPAARIACGVDCAASTVRMGRPELWWCAGCQGMLSPYSGMVGASASDLSGALLAVERMAALLHRRGIARRSWGTTNRAMCRGDEYNFNIDKTGYRFQLANPVKHVKGKLTCPPFGRTTLFYENGRGSLPGRDDYTWVVWRKRNCCASPPE